MDAAEVTSAAPSAGADVEADVETLRALLGTATQRLLGDTITVSDADWRAPSSLPGWTRAHVASHLARHADATRRLVQGALSGQPQPMYASAERRDFDIEAGSQRSGLELQQDLDTAAEALEEAFVAITEADAWDVTVELRGGDQVPTRLLPLTRLSEVVLHHVDLDIGFVADDVDQKTAQLLLQWCAFRLRRRTDFPRLLLVADSGFSQPIGSSGDSTTVEGTSAGLLGWVTRRRDGRDLTGAAGLDLPTYG